MLPWMLQVRQGLVLVFDRAQGLAAAIVVADAAGQMATRR